MEPSELARGGEKSLIIEEDGGAKKLFALCRQLLEFSVGYHLLFRGVLLLCSQNSVEKR